MYDLHNFNLNATVQQLQSSNSMILQDKLKEKNPLLIHNLGSRYENLHNYTFEKLIKPGDSIYVKPFVQHSFSGNGKLVVLRVGGRIPGDSQRELSIIGKRNAQRAINETMQWFDPKGRN